VSAPSPLQLRQHSLSTTNRHLTRALLVLSIHHLAMIKHHSPAPIPVAHARRPAMLLAEERLSIAQEQHLVALDAVDLAPRVHHPAVIGRNRSDDIDTLLAELLDVLDVWGEVVRLAAGCEGACIQN
jgi:hypothetical protein